MHTARELALPAVCSATRFMPYQLFEGTLNATGLRIGVVVSRFNEFITEALAKGPWKLSKSMAAALMIFCW